jgi:C1A family cysteine protease
MNIPHITTRGTVAYCQPFNTTSRKSFSYKFQPKDTRDYMYSSSDTVLSLSLSNSEQLKQSMVALTAQTQPTQPTQTTDKYLLTNLADILDQGDLGDCVANAFAYAISCETNKSINISRLHLYEICRILDNAKLSDDCGTYIRSACKAIKSWGFASETKWPYNTAKFSTFSTLDIFNSSRLFSSFVYTFVPQNVTSLKSCLIQGKPVIFGIQIYTSFMTSKVASTGMIPIPNLKTDKLVGGHCVVMVGYDDVMKCFVCANSWGTGWGMKGYFYLPYLYALNSAFAGDFCFATFII